MAKAISVYAKLLATGSGRQSFILVGACYDSLGPRHISKMVRSSLGSVPACH